MKSVVCVCVCVCCVYVQVLVSKDGDQWVLVLDYSRLKCFSTQRLFFPKMAIKSGKFLKFFALSHA